MKSSTEKNSRLLLEKICFEGKFILLHSTHAQTWKFCFRFFFQLHQDNLQKKAFRLENPQTVWSFRFNETKTFENFLRFFWKSYNFDSSLKNVSLIAIASWNLQGSQICWNFDIFLHIFNHASNQSSWFQLNLSKYWLRNLICNSSQPKQPPNHAKDSRNSLHNCCLIKTLLANRFCTIFVTGFQLKANTKI